MCVPDKKVNNRRDPRLGGWNMTWRWDSFSADHADFLNPCISDTLITNKDQVSEDREAQCVWLSFLSQDIKT